MQTELSQKDEKYRVFALCAVLGGVLLLALVPFAAALVTVVVVREIRRNYGISISGFSGREEIIE
ncbi:MAG: hypothetical protein LUH00_00505 [Lachnospiraceae bacterium]|nr:hypothetical protein [Lachnospiraceae bacterium]